MAQVTIYLSDEVLREVRRRAKRARQSVSAYVGGIVAMVNVLP